jgi:Ca2+/Na+ antiporter
MQGFNSFIEDIFSKQYLLLFIIVLVALILVVVFMLIKLQYSERKEEDEEDEEDLAFNNNKNSKVDDLVIDKKIQNDVVKNDEKEEEAREEISENKEEKKDSLEDLFNIEFEQIENLSKDKDLNDKQIINNEINDNDDESTAIISNTELLSKQKSIKEELGFDNETIIRAYEEEQEKKAIISYDELLNNAKALRDTFKIPEKESSESEVIVNPIEVETEQLHVTSYIVEEEFLNTLKKFRLNLK